METEALRVGLGVVGPKVDRTATTSRRHGEDKRTATTPRRHEKPKKKKGK